MINFVHDMNTYVMIAAGVLPAALLWLYIWKSDPKPEPLSLLMKALLYGVLIIIPLAVVEPMVSQILFGEDSDPRSMLGAVLDSFCVAAIPEEGFKLLALWLIVRRNPYFDEHFDGIVYAVSVGLGFAAVENIFYVFSDMEQWRSIALMRALMAVPGHYAFAVIMGYYFSKYHFVEKSTRNAVLTIVAPVIAHGTYNSLLTIGGDNELVSTIGFVLVVVFCIKMHKSAYRKIMAQLRRDAGTLRG